jgi:hypothetical protein
VIRVEFSLPTTHSCDLRASTVDRFVAGEADAARPVPCLTLWEDDSDIDGRLPIVGSAKYNISDDPATGTGEGRRLRMRSGERLSRTANTLQLERPRKMAVKGHNCKIGLPVVELSRLDLHPVCICYVTTVPIKFCSTLEYSATHSSPLGPSTIW